MDILKSLFKRKGQSTGEYAILILIIVGAIATMQVFLKRGQQATIRHIVLNSLINVGTENSVFDGTIQFEPYYVDKRYDRNSTSVGQEKMKVGGSMEVYRHSQVNIDSGGKYYEKTTGVKKNADEWNWNATI